MARAPVFPALLLMSLLSVSARADYLDDTGFTALKQELGIALPDGGGVSVTQVEYGIPEYLPQAGEGVFAGAGNFTGKVFTAAGGAGSVSGHAAEVAAQFFGVNANPAFGRASFTPGIREIDVYRVDADDTPASWLQAAWLRPAGGGAPLPELRAVQNHSWISFYEPDSAQESNEGLRRLDFAITRDGFLCIAGTGNGTSLSDTPPVPAYMVSGYNSLAAGLSSGVHSTGGVLEGLDGPGRQKPELVAPLDYTSFSTALISSAAALLREKANALTPNARLPFTLKAILLAGATKEEFPAWSRTAAAPLDARYGAGELNIQNSLHILTGVEQPASSSSPRPAEAWSTVILKPSGGTADWLLRIPPGEKGAALSAVAVWHRLIRNSGSSGIFDPVPEPLADYNLTISRLSGSSAALSIDESRSTIENLEHLYQRDLPSGLYRLRLSLDSTATAGVSACTVAWRLHTAPNLPVIAAGMENNQLSLTFSSLLPGQAYQIETSADLNSWTAFGSFTAALSTDRRTVKRPSSRLFYRLKVVDP